MSAVDRAGFMRPRPTVVDRGRMRDTAGGGSGLHALRAIAAVACLLLAAGCAAAPARKPAREELVPPDPGAITVFGRYQPSLESLAPAGVEIGDLNMVDGRLVLQVRADGDAARKALVRALERSPWYRDARWETPPGDARVDEAVLSVRPLR